MRMVENRVTADFEGTADFVIADPTFELAGNMALLVKDFRRCERC
jgi:hypothetical protein